MATLSTQFAHILIYYYSNRSSSAVKLFISEPSKTQEEKLGRLFGILEINTPSRENPQIIDYLINSLEETYYSNLEKSDLPLEKIFENTLNEINQKFDQILKEKKFYLVGNLNESTVKEKINLIIGVIKDNKTYLSHLNNIGLFLIHKTKQDYKLIDIKKITVDENEPEPTVNKLFSNLLDGELKPDDFLFLANTNFLNYISKERIQKIVTSLPINKAAEYFKNYLLQHEGNNFAAIILKNTKDQLAEKKELSSLTSITELNYTEDSTEKLLAPSIWDGLKNLSKKVFHNIRQQTTKVKLSDPQKSAKFETPKVTNINQPVSLGKKILADKKAQAKNLLKQIFKKKEYKPSKFKEKLHNLKLFLKLQTAKIGNKLKAIPSLSKILLIAALFLIVLFIYSTSYFKQKQNTEVDSQQFNDAIAEIEQLHSEAESTLIFGDEKTALTKIKEAQSLLAKLEVKSQRQKDKFEEINQAVENTIEKLRHITNITEPVLIADLSNTQATNNIDVKNIAYLANKLYAIDANNNNAYKINIDNREISTIAANINDLGQFVKAKAINDYILIYHKKQGFVQIKNDKFSLINVTLAANNNISDFATYNERLYTIDIGNNQIYRHPNQENGFGVGVAWLKEALDVKSINSISIDTNIWATNATNQIIKLNKGLKQDFAIKNLEPQLEQANQIYATEQTNYLYILESKNQRIIVLDKEGNLKTQYYSAIFDNLKAMEIVEKEKKVFLVNDNKIYFFNLLDIK